MLKKVAIAGLAVVIGVAILAWISPPLFDWIVQQGKNVKEGAENAIPLEQRIDVLQGKLKDLEKNKAKYYEQAANAKDKVDELTADVARMTKDLDAQWTAMAKLRNDLNGSDVRVSYKNVSYDHGQAQKVLKQELDAYDTAEKSLNAKKDQLSATSQALQAAREQLANLENDNAAMQARLEQMRAELALVKQKEDAAHIQSNDNERASLKAEMDDVDKKIKHRETVLDLHGEFDQGHADAPADKPVDNDVLKRFDEKAAQKDGKPADLANKP